MLARRIGLRLSRSERLLTPRIEDYSWDGYVKFTDVKWLEHSNNMTIYLDDAVSEALRDECKFRVAVLAEPSAWMPAVYRNAILNRTNFDLIMTYDDELLKLGSPFTRFIRGGTLASIDSINEPLQPKSNLVSMPLSSKKILPGHNLRHRVYHRLKQRKDLQLDGYGAGAAKPYIDALEPYKEHYFTVAIENHRSDYYMTEKLIEPLLCKTVPIYWGGEAAVKELFNPLGIIFASDYGQIVSAASKLSIADYQSRKLAIDENFEIARSLISQEANLLAQISHESSRLEDGENAGFPSSEFLIPVPTSVGRHPAGARPLLNDRIRQVIEVRFAFWLPFLGALMSRNVPSPMKMMKYLRVW